ncbi:MAG: hypothetical protein AMXMBFR13_40830 [Phycisphaerae bacterium]
MKNFSLLVLALPLGLAVPLLSGCAATSDEAATTPDQMGRPGATYESREKHATATDGHVVACQICYDQVKIIRQEHGKGTQWSRSQIIREHQCSDCRAMATFYTKDGVPMFKCAKCAPEGVACDKCLPPQAGS